MPILKQLRDAGFAVWPFDAPRFPMVVEIYPRVLTGPVVKGREGGRRQYLETRYPSLTPQVLADASRSDDSFDALVSALVMAGHTEEFSVLTPARDADQLFEGQIWFPNGGRKAPAPAAATSPLFAHPE
jgi:hypothetical protein